MFHKPPRWASAALTALVVALVLVIGFASMPGQAAPASPGKPTTTARIQLAAATSIPVSNAYGAWFGGHWFGSYRNGPYLMYCVTPLGGLNRGQPVSVINVWTAIGATKSDELKDILTNFGNTGDPAGAAAVYIALNEITGISAATVNAWVAHVPAGIRAIAASYVRHAQLYHGQSTVTIRVVRPVLVGQVGTAVVSVSNSRGLPGKLVMLAAANASIPRTARTAGNGQAAVNFTRTGTGVVSIYTSVPNLVPPTMLISRPGPGQQVLVSFRPFVTLSAHTSFQVGPAKPTATVACTATCNGKPPVTFGTCNGAGVLASFLLFDNNRATKALVLKPGQCGSATVSVPDKHKVTFGVTYDVRARWTPVLMFGGFFIVNCPALPNILVVLNCTCDSGGITIQGVSATVGTPIVNATTDQWEVVYNGVTTLINPGQSHPAIVVNANGQSVPYMVSVGARATINDVWKMRTVATGVLLP